MNARGTVSGVCGFATLSMEGYVDIENLALGLRERSSSARLQSSCEKGDGNGLFGGSNINIGNGWHH